MFRFAEFINEAKKSRNVIIDTFLQKLNDAGSTYTFHFESIGLPSEYDGNLIGLAVNWDEEDENGPAAHISSADNYEEVPKSLDDPTAITYGNFGTQRTYSIEFDSFKEALQYIIKGGLDKMLEWYQSSKRNETITQSYSEIPQKFKI